MNVADAEKNFATVVNKVYFERISVDLERDSKVIARLATAPKEMPFEVKRMAYGGFTVLVDH